MNCGMNYGSVPPEVRESGRHKDNTLKQRGRTLQVVRVRDGPFTDGYEVLYEFTVKSTIARDV